MYFALIFVVFLNANISKTKQQCIYFHFQVYRFKIHLYTKNKIKNHWKGQLGTSDFNISLNVAIFNIYRRKKETSALHLCLFIPNECSYFIQLFCFNNVDYLAMLCTKQKSIRWSLAPKTTPQTPVPKFRKSQNQYLVCPQISLTVAVHLCPIERTHCWVVISAMCIPCGHDSCHKSVT